MLAIVHGLYAFFILCYILVAFFVIYHLINYAINSRFSQLMVSFFLLVSIFLFLSNVILFFSVDWNETITNFFPNNFNSF
jgi:hypothetical protein